jgi:hypothetical protein
MKLRPFLLVLSLLIVSPNTPSQNLLVTGRAVDEQHKPIAGAIATLYYPPCRDCIDHILPVGFSLEDGVFFVELTGVSSNIKLFIEERVPRGFWSPLADPPFDNLSRNPDFKGIPINSQGKSTVHLGDVRVRIRYSRLIIDLSRLIPWYAPNQQTAGALRLDLKDDRGKLIYNGSLPNVAFDPTFSSVNLALTKGKWAMEFFLPSQGASVRPLRLTVTIKTPGCTRITIDNGRKSYRPCE